MAGPTPDIQGRGYRWRRALRGCWTLARPFWTSEERWAALGLLALVVALSLGTVYLLVQFNQWQQGFYDALQKYDLAAFWSLMGRFCLLAAIFVVAGVLRRYLTKRLRIRWRLWMTRRFLDHWLTDKSHYLWQLSDKATDNPDQRIAEDVRDFVEQSLGLSLGLLDNAVTLGSFVGILWALSGPLTIPLGGARGVSLPGYMAWACLLYAGVATWINHRIGRPLIGLNYQQQHREADFRFGLVRLRENGESVAFSDGEDVERGGLDGLFAGVYANFRALIRKELHLDLFSSGYGQAAVVFPYLLAAPRYFSKAIGLGVLNQMVDAFGQVQGALSWVVNSYDVLAFWSSVVERLEGFETEIAATKALRRRAQAVLGDAGGPEELRLRGLALSLPGGEPLTGALDQTFRSGQSVLISGASGCGKSTLLRALSGLWPFAEGQALLPRGERMVLPQKPYLPLGTLRQALAYPAAAAAVTEEAMQEVLALVHLAHLRPHLDHADDWSKILSVGEQQRVAWARVFLRRPRWLLLDEATSALDEDTQAALYRALRERLPEATLISVAHRQDPQRHHQRVWAFGAGPS